ncbi:hypothetical protein [Aquimarina rubra]|uniref:Lipoprotein n=1 Tax=Aquimarina rubra TaxID=1920033 RepID=A0ABW5LCC7_9FLAO
MKSVLIYLAVFIVLFSCKNSSNQSQVSKIKLESDTAAVVSKDFVNKQIGSTNFVIPKEIETPEQLKKIIPFEIEKTEIIDFNGDGNNDYLCRANKAIENGELVVEYWVTSDFTIKRENEIYIEYDYKWFINLDKDKDLELVKAQGDEDGISYGIYKQDFSLKNDKILFYFNPVIEMDGKYYWGYPWEILDLKIKAEDSNEIKTSLSHKIVRDGNIKTLEDQSILPAIIFSGKSKMEMEILNLNNIGYLSVYEIQKNIFFNKK